MVSAKVLALKIIERIMDAASLLIPLILMQAALLVLSGMNLENVFLIAEKMLFTGMGPVPVKMATIPLTEYVPLAQKTDITTITSELVSHYVEEILTTRMEDASAWKVMLLLVENAINAHMEADTIPLSKNVLTSALADTKYTHQMAVSAKMDIT